METRKTTNGSTKADTRERPGAGAPPSWLLRVTYTRDEHDAEEMEATLPRVIRQEVAHADGDATESQLDFLFTSESEAIAAAVRVDKLALEHVEVEIYDL